MSYRQGLEWIARHDASPLLNVTAQNGGLIENNLAIMKPEERARFRVGGAGPEQYFLGAYRTHPGPYPEDLGNEVHAENAFGIKILSVIYKW